MQIKLKTHSAPHITRVSSPLSKTYLALINALNHHPLVKNVSPLIDPGDYQSVDFPPKNSLIELRVYLDGTGACLEDTGAVGLFLVAENTPNDAEQYPDYFGVIVNSNPEWFLSYVQDERQDEMDPESDHHDHEYLLSVLTTLTHELCHAMEFIAHSHGLTPQAVIEVSSPRESEDGDLIYDFDVPLQDLCTGYGLRKEMSCLGNPHEIEQLMEARVEENGKRLLADCFNPGVVGAAQAKRLNKTIERCLGWMREEMHARLNKPLVKSRQR